MATENLRKKSRSILLGSEAGKVVAKPWRFGSRVMILGMDLAWGARNPDGLCALDFDAGRARVEFLGLSWGDDDLLAWVQSRAGTGQALLAVDAPVVVPNETGMRLVDRLAHVHFGRFKCGSYPANQKLCARPHRLAQQLEALGFPPGWQGPRSTAEVYPHPALVRWFGLAERIPYKKGRVTEKRANFARLQILLREWLRREVPEFEWSEEVVSLLAKPWSKGVEDQTDALLCALIGYWHLRHEGRRSQVLGDTAEGFLLVPGSQE